MIIINNLQKKYKNGDMDTEVLQGVNMQVKRGEFVAVMGRSGCGKSTLLNIIGGMDKADNGSYLFDGEQVLDYNSQQLANFRNKKVGFVFQAFHLLQEFSVADNIALPLGYAGIGAKQRKRTALELLEQIGLVEKAGRRPFQLSGGEQQRVAIARAISNQPEVLLADEPTGSLDEENGIRILELLKNLNERGLTIIMVTHDIKVSEYADRVIRITDGKVK